MDGESLSLSSSRPYLLRGFYEWIVDNSLTPYLLVDATLPGVLVPPASVSNGQIVLNVNSAAVQRLTLDNDAVRFGARFAGVHWEICVPIEAVLAVYAKENGRGITFNDEEQDQPGTPSPDNSDSPVTGRPQLKLVT